MYDGKSLYWYKYGFEFPDKSTIANKVRIKKHYLINDEMNETNYDFLSNISFDNVFIEITDEAIVSQLSNLHLIPENCTISFLYGNIERIHCIYIYGENIYINKTVYMPSDDSAAIGTVHWYLLEENFKYLFLERI